MVYGVILASGVGNRMGTKLPKQFLEIAGIPVIAYTIYSMLAVSQIDSIIIVSHPDYIEKTHEILKQYFDNDDNKKIKVIAGGKERIDSIDNAVTEVTASNSVGQDDIIIFHDAVRPFVTRRILESSITGAHEKGAVVAGIPAVDTMLYSEDGSRVDDIPERSRLFNGQAPDTFRLELFLRLRNALSEEDRKKVFGTSKLCELNGEPIYIIPGDEMNFKITTPADMKKAEAYLALIEEENNESFKFKRNR